MSYAVTLTIPTMSGSLSNFPIVLTAADFPAAAINGGATSIDNGGGNLKIYTDSTKTTQVPIDVVEFATGVSPSVEVHALIPVAATGNTLYAVSDDVQVSQPPVDSTYGRNSVWSGICKAAWHFSGSTSLVDVTGNGHTLTGSGTPSNVAGALGSAVQFDGSSDYYTSSTQPRGESSFCEFMIMSSPDVTGGSSFISDDSSGTSGGLQSFITTDGKFNSRLDDSGSNVAQFATSSSVDDNLAKWLHTNFDRSGNAQHFINGSANGSPVSMSSFGDISPTETFTIGSQAPAAQKLFGGWIDEYRIYSFIPSADWVETDYNSQSGSWLTVGSWVEEGGGAGSYSPIIDLYYKKLLSGG